MKTAHNNIAGSFYFITNIFLKLKNFLLLVGVYIYEKIFREGNGYEEKIIITIACYINLINGFNTSRLCTCYRAELE